MCKFLVFKIRISMLLELINVSDTSCKSQLFSDCSVVTACLLLFYSHWNNTQISPGKSWSWSLLAVSVFSYWTSCATYSVDVASSRKWYNWMIFPILQALCPVLISSSLRTSAGSLPSQFLNLTQEVMTSTRFLPKTLSRKKTWVLLELKLIKVIVRMWTSAEESQQCVKFPSSQCHICSVCF